MEKFSRIPLSLPSLPSRMSRSHERGVDRVVSKTSAKVTPVQSILRHIEPHLFALLESPEYPPTWSTIFHSSPLPSIPTCLSSATPQSPRNPPLTKRATRRWGEGGEEERGCYPRADKKHLVPPRIGNTIGIVIRGAIGVHPLCSKKLELGVAIP